MEKRKTYLGDGVYADVERGMVRLTTENGITVSNVIYLEAEVLAALWDWAAPENTIAALDAIETGDAEAAHAAADRLLLMAVPLRVRAAYERVRARARYWATS